MKFRNLVVVATAMLAFAGCKKDDKKAAGGSGGGATEQPDVAAPGSLSTNDILSMLPSDSQVIARINFNAIKKSTIWSKFEGKITEELNGEADFQEMKKHCGFDPMETISKVWVGGKVEDEKSMIVVVEGIPKDKMLACSDKTDKWKKDGDYFTQPDGTALAFAGDNAIVVAAGGKSPLETALAKKGTLASSADYKNVKSSVKTGASIWFAVTKIPDDATKGGQIPVTPKSAMGSVELAKGFDLDLTVNLKDESEAKMMEQMVPMGLGAMQAQLEQAGAPAEAKDAVKKIKFSSKGPAFNTKLNLSNKEVGALVDAMMKMM